MKIAKGPLLLAIILVLAGCLNTAPIELKSTLEDVVVFSGSADYHWYGYTMTDSNGNTLANTSLVNRTNEPLFVEQLVPDGGGDPGVGVTSKNDLFVAAHDSVWRSSDGGKNWQAVYQFHSPTYPTIEDRWESVSTSLWIDPATDAIFAGFLYEDGGEVGSPGGSRCAHLASSRDGGSTWAEHPFAWCHGAARGEWLLFLGGGRPGAGFGPRFVMSSGLPNNLYLCANAGLYRECAISTNGGDTFQGFPAQDIMDDCPGVSSGSPAVNPRDGTIVLPVGEFHQSFVRDTLGVYSCPDNGLAVVASSDNGLIWQGRRSQNGSYGSAEPVPDVVFTPDGTGYLAFVNRADRMVYVYRTKDNFGTSWEGPFRVSPPDHTLSAFVAVTAGDNGSIAVAYAGTRSPQEPGWPNTPAFATLDTHWHLFVSTSVNAAEGKPVFLTQQVTPAEDPVQIGCIVQPYLGLYGGQQAGYGPCSNLLRYIDASTDADGRVYVGFTDGCTPRGGCTGDTYTGHMPRHGKDHELAVAVLDRGVGLWGKELPSLNLSHPDIRPRGTDPPHNPQ